jgi:hypothetical protein
LALFFTIRNLALDVSIMSLDEAALEAQSQTGLITWLSIIFVIVSAASVALRLYTRKRILDIVGSDDLAIIVAHVLAIAVSIATILGMV